MGVYSQESEDSTLALNGRESRQSGKSRLTSTAEECSQSTSQTPHELPTSAIAAESNSLTESTIARGESTCLGLTSSAGDSPAKTSATPASERESTESAAGYGANTRESFASYDRATSSWRTSQLCLDGAWSEFSEIWPKSGMTRNGRAFELPTWERVTDESDYGSFPTPAAFDAYDVTEFRKDSNIEDGGRHSVSLTHFVEMWPTPVANMGERGGRGDLLALVRGMPNKHSGMWATPTKVTAEHPGRVKIKPHQQDCLSAQVNRVMLPTPRAFMHKDAITDRGKGNLGEVIGGQLNPTWVEWLMGYPLGWTALEDSETPLSRKSRNGLEGE